MAAYRINQVLIFLILACPAFGQNQVLDLNKEIRLKPGSIRLDSLLQSASQQTGAVFSYNSKKINTHQHIQLKDDLISLAKIFTLLKEEKGVSIKTLENYVIIPTYIKQSGKKIPVKTAASQRINSANFKISQSPTADINSNKVKTSTSSSSLKIDSLPKQELKKKDETAITDSIKAGNGKVQNPSLTGNTVSTPSDSAKRTVLKKNSEKGNEKRPEKKISTPKSSATEGSLFLKFGIAIDESLYTGILAQVGIPLLYATVSANTNYSVSQIRYGLGTSFKIRNDLQLHFNFNVGDLQKSGLSIDSARVKFPVEVKSQLTRFMVAAEFSPNKKLKIQVGPVLDYLKTNYFINSIPSDLRTFRGNGDHLFYTLNPPYVITNTYSPTSNSNIKTWIGLQMSVLYFLKF